MGHADFRIRGTYVRSCASAQADIELEKKTGHMDYQNKFRETLNRKTEFGSAEEGGDYVSKSFTTSYIRRGRSVL